MTTFIDTNILIALAKTTEPHHEWSVEQFNICRANGPVIISDLVYAELSMGFQTRADVDRAIAVFGLTRLRSSDDVHFLAGKAFHKYRKTNKGQKKNVLPDFLIGALATVQNAPLMTANAPDFTGYFPSLQLISP
jgi:predicted nucleic acid-binding protein